MPKTVHVIGGGLAGVEAAYCLAQSHIPVVLWEMRPVSMTPAHKTDLLSELICSNSFKGADPVTAHGLLKKELSELRSLVLTAAHATRVPSGKALAVDRRAFAQRITAIITAHPRIEVIRKEVLSLNLDIPTIIATGPLTSETLAGNIAQITDRERLFFYDAISPIVDAESIDYSRAFFGSRWSGDDRDYLNCSLDRDAYTTLVQALLKADKVSPHPFEDIRFFEGCLPIEVIAARGHDSLRFGPMRPVGLINPHTGKRPYAVLQLRKEDLKGDAYNLVGFQTRLTYAEQQRVLRLIPALHAVRFLRFGSMHRNTFIESPQVLGKDLSLKGHRHIIFAGQITGVEGYMESAATGIMAAYSMLAVLKGKPFTPPLPESAIGALLHYITDEHISVFQPMNINFGIFPTPDVPKKMKRSVLLQREELAFTTWLASIDYL